MLERLDKILNQITMYRLVLYFLTSVLLLAIGLAFLSLVPYSVTEIILSTAFLVGLCWVTNMLLASIMKVPVATESSHISALILALIISPATSLEEYGFLAWAAVFTSVSKYVFNLYGKHIFNPAAFGVWVAGVGLAASASWWVGREWLTPLVLFGGLLIVRKIRRFDLAFSFIGASLTTVTAFSLLSSGATLLILQKTLLSTPLFFVAFVMLTEPLTTPPTKRLQIVYGAITGILFVPELHIGKFFTTPESAILFGNVFSYVVSPKRRFMLRLKGMIQQTPTVWDLVFEKPKEFSFTPGQYMEWTMPHRKPDARGNRRYFTIASSPTEDTVRLGIKFGNKVSSFKRGIGVLDPGGSVVAGSLAGDFTLPKEFKRCVLIGGGIGMTPFRSMAVNDLDKRTQRPVVLLCTAKTSSELVYKDLFDRCARELGWKVFYLVGQIDRQDLQNVQVGKIDQEYLRQFVGCDTRFYISGQQSMVDKVKDQLGKLGTPGKNIKTDYFPGFV